MCTEGGCWDIKNKNRQNHEKNNKWKQISSRTRLNQTHDQMCAAFCSFGFFLKCISYLFLNCCPQSCCPVLLPALSPALTLAVSLLDRWLGWSGHWCSQKLCKQAAPSSDQSPPSLPFIQSATVKLRKQHKTTPPPTPSSAELCCILPPHLPLSLSLYSTASASLVAPV